MAVDKEIVTMVRHSYKRCCARGDFFDRFYDRFLAQSSDIAEMFADTNWHKQKHLIEHGIRSAILYAEEPDMPIVRQHMTEIAQRHAMGDLNIAPKFYPIWLDCMITTIAECDPEYTSELEDAWRSVLMATISLMIATYKVSERTTL